MLLGFDKESGRATLGALWIRLQSALQAAPELGFLKWAIRGNDRKMYEVLGSYKIG